jgi:mevalonate kinase
VADAEADAEAVADAVAEAVADAEADADAEAIADAEAGAGADAVSARALHDLPGARDRGLLVAFPRAGQAVMGPQEVSSRGVALDGAGRGAWRACGKLILFGEHFVVHGAPALALPLRGVCTSVVVEQDPGPDGPRLVADLPGPALATSQRLLALALQRLGIEDQASHLRVTAESGIPIGQGLGSSAAFAVALIGALCQAVSRRVSEIELRDHAHALEGLVHGTPSGIDPTVIAFQRPLWFVKGEQPLFLDLPRPVRWVLASSGVARSTGTAVERVRAVREARPDEFDTLCREATEVAQRGRAALEAGDAAELGSLMDRNHALLQALGVSTPALDQLAAVAREAGAHGAKLTGAGLGGFVVALVTLEREAAVVAAWRRWGAPVVLQTDEDRGAATPAAEPHVSRRDDQGGSP